ncbi:MAG: YadA-like family protein [Alcaligenaceae bacterium]|nr:YadA-like family protein [Alcaligenaceae bacterium]
MNHLTVVGDTALNHVTVSEGAIVDLGGKLITNLAPGEDAGDVVNVSKLQQIQGNASSQIDQLRNDYDNRFNRLDKRAEAGAAAAIVIAGLSQPYILGKSLVAVGGSTFDGQAGYAAGLSRISDNGKWIHRGSVSGFSREHLGANASVGYQW